jgi:hypothetical protein
MTPVDRAANARFPGMLVGACGGGGASPFVGGLPPVFAVTAGLFTWTRSFVDFPLCPGGVFSEWSSHDLRQNQNLPPTTKTMKTPQNEGLRMQEFSMATE